MTPLVLVVVPGMGPLALSVEALAEAQARGRELMPAQFPSPSSQAISDDALLTPDELEKRTKVPARWWLDQAREHRVPHRRIGRSVRFVISEVMACEAVKRRGVNGS